MSPNDTIVAPATPPGRGGVAVIRVSGPLVKKIMAGMQLPQLKPRYATYTTFKDANEEVLDLGIALYFPGPNSFTGEDVLEFQGHGGRALTNQLVSRIISLGARLARPGEFSERAFLNGKIDLMQAEAIADLINASSEQAARSALRSLQGEFSKKINILVESIINLRTYIEAAIDFVEEEIDFLQKGEIHKRLNQALDQLQQLQQSAKQGQLLQEGIHLVIAGLPNVGKSSLLNALSEKESAIVTDIAGTTRDLLRETIVLDGMPIHVIDTAGLRESDDLVEQEGIRRAEHAMQKADVILWVSDIRSCEALPLTKLIQQTPLIWALNKIDLVNQKASLKHEAKNIFQVSLSAKTGEGMTLLKEQIKTCIGLQTTDDIAFSARQRHLDAMARAFVCIQNALQHCTERPASELLAEELRLAQRALNEMTGEFSSDDLLGRIFSSFCIGK